jgi:hypothetical protein
MFKKKVKTESKSPEVSYAEYSDFVKAKKEKELKKVKVEKKE